MKDKRRTRAQRGERTRAKILAVARKHFAADGYERATIRAIAADAGIDPSLVMRYFTNKEGLFVAAAEFDLHIPTPHNFSRRQAGKHLVAHFLETWGKDDILRALLRTASTNELAAERMRAIAATQATAAIAAICGDPESAPIRANLISSQFLGFAYCRYVLALPVLAAMHHSEVIAYLAPTVQRYLFMKL